MKSSLQQTVWTIEMLGGLRATCGDRVISRFRSRRGGALFAYLAYHHHRSHTRDALIELLWPESHWKAGRTCLRTELTWLRRALEPPEVPAGSVLVTAGDTLQLHPACCCTDVALFEAALGSAAEVSDSSVREEWLARAVRFYQGELLPGYFEGWVLPERLRLSELAVQAVTRLVKERETASDLAGALQFAWRGLGIDPLREQTYDDLIRLLMATGQSEVALRQHRERDRLLRQEAIRLFDPASPELGSGPASLLQQKLHVQAAAAEALSQQLVQRTEEVEELHRRLEAEMAETRKLRQELAVSRAKARELERQLEQADQQPRWRKD